MARTRTTGTLAATLLAGSLLAASAGTADAFFWRRDTAPEPAPAPAAVAPTVPVEVLPPPRPMAVSRPAPAASAGAAPLAIVPGTGTPAAAAQPAAPIIAASAPLPPRPPTDLSRGPAPAPSPAQAAPIVTASAGPIAVPAAAPAAAPAAPEPVRVAAVAPATDAEIVAAANAYFNGIDALTGRFSQVGSDGRRYTGILYVDRPGKLRFEYDAPATIQVIADGRSVVVRDRQLGTQDMYPISQTPLKFLLGDRIRLGQDIQVLGVERTSEEVDVLLRDRSTFAGSSDIRLTFDQGLSQLREWRIVDAQGFETRVSLSGVERHAGLDSGLFQISYERMHEQDTY